MKLPQRFTKRAAILTISALAIAVMAGAVYAAVSLTIQNTATIVTGAPNLFVAINQLPTTTCTTTGPTYSDTGVTIAWGNVAAGSSNNQFVCLENTGAAHTLTVTESGLSAAQGVISATINGQQATGQTINGGTAVMVDFNFVVDPNAPTGSVTFQINLS